MWYWIDASRGSRRGSTGPSELRPRAWAGIVIALASSCSGVPTWTLRTSTIGGRSIELAALPCQERAAEWRTILATDADTPPAFEGMEGSPVRDEDGAVRGYVAEAWTGLGRGLVRVRPMSDFARLPATSAEVSRNAIHLPMAPHVEPGESVGLLVWSGDSTSVEAWGTVTAVDGDIARCAFPDRRWGAASRAPGACVYGLARAPIVAFGEGNNGSIKVCSVGETIGVVFAEDAACVVAWLGARPKSVALDLSYECDGRALVEAHIEIVRDPDRVAGRLVAAISTQLERMLVPAGAHCEAQLLLDDDPRSSIEFLGLQSSAWRKRVEAQVISRLQERADPPERVRLRVRLLSE